MEIDFFNVFATVLSLIVLIIPGYLLTKCKFITEKAGEAFSTFVLYGSQTLMVFMSFQGKEYSRQTADFLLSKLPFFLYFDALFQPHLLFSFFRRLQDEK